jgi:hypothetical protein
MAVTQFACISVNSAQFIGRRLSSAWHLPLGVQTSSPPGFGSPFVFSGYFNGWGEPDLAIAHSGDNTVTVLPVSIKSRRFSGQLALFANPNDPSTYLCAFSQ